MRTKLFLTSIAALFLATGSAHANIASVSVPRTIVVLWAQEATTKDYVWVPDETYEVLQECLDRKKKLENNPMENKDTKGFIRSLKCTRYRR